MFFYDPVVLEPWSIREHGAWKYIKKLWYWKLVERRIAQNASWCLFTTKRELIESSKLFRFQGPRKVVTPYGVHVSGSQNGGGCATQLPEKRSKYVLFMGRLHPCKNIPLLLEAWARAKRPTEWKLIVAGPSSLEYSRFLRATAAEFGCSDSVEFHGFVAGYEKDDLLSRAKWFVLPSEHENFGLAALEALGHGVPIVVSDQVYLVDGFQPPCERLPVDVMAWSRFFSERMVDEEWRLKVMHANQASALQHLQIEDISRCWAAAINDMFGGQSGSAASGVAVA